MQPQTYHNQAQALPGVPLYDQVDCRVSKMPDAAINHLMIATTDDPELKCFVQDCNYLGQSLCHWKNCCLRLKDGGCGRRFC